MVGPGLRGHVPRLALKAQAGSPNANAAIGLPLAGGSKAAPRGPRRLATLATLATLVSLPALAASPQRSLLLSVGELAPPGLNRGPIAWQFGRVIPKALLLAPARAQLGLSSPLPLLGGVSSCPWARNCGANSGLNLLPFLSFLLGCVRRLRLVSQRAWSKKDLKTARGYHPLALLSFPGPPSLPSGSGFLGNPSRYPKTSSYYCLSLATGP